MIRATALSSETKRDLLLSEQKPEKTETRGRKPGVGVFNQEVADEILELIANGGSLNRICGAGRPPHFPGVGKFMEWLRDSDATDDKSFVKQYARARERQADFWAQEILEIADASEHDTITTKDGDEKPDHEWISRSKLRVDTRKWLMSKQAPKKYGDKIVNEHSGLDGEKLSVTLIGADAKL